MKTQKPPTQPDINDPKSAEYQERIRQKTRRRAYLWARMFPLLYQIDFRARKLKDREIYKENMIDILDKGNKACINWVEPGIKKALEQVISIEIRLFLRF